jgi:putative ABC transport system substrate-binding protein
LNGCGLLADLGKPVARVSRVGILDGSPADDPAANDEIAGLERGLAELGYVDSRNVVFEQRGSDGKAEPLPALANELIRLPVDVLVSLSSPATLAARQATTVTPIVFVGITDPVGQGLVANLGHPGGNLTGGTAAPPTTFQKELQILKQVVPQLLTVAIIRDVSNPASTAVMDSRLQATTTAATAMGVQLKVLDVHSAEDIQTALVEALDWPANALMSFGGTGAVTNAASRIASFAEQHRIPVTFTAKEQVQDGGLLSYGASFTYMGHAAASHVDKILKGAKPADLPVEQPTEFELIVNRTTVQALGLTIPPEVAAQVTEWVQ